MQLLTPLIAFGLCAGLHAAALRLFPRAGLLDFPERYGLKRARLPYPTGILALLTFALCLPLGFGLTFQSGGLLLGALLLGIVCFIDDRRPLPAWLRLALQIGVALIIFVTGTRIYTLTNPFEGLLGGAYLKLDGLLLPTDLFGPLPILAGVFTVFWLLLTINALNWFDGIPGQTSVLSTIGFATIGLLSSSPRVDQQDLALLAFTLAGISLACTLFDAPKKVIPGDSGSMFFGLMLGALTIYAGGKVATAFLVLGVPLLDLLIVVLRRASRGDSPLKGSLAGDHLHHRLLAKGWSHWNVIVLNAALGSLFGITALFLSTPQKALAALILFGVMLWLSYYSRSGESSRRPQRSQGGL